MLSPRLRARVLGSRGPEKSAAGSWKGTLLNFHDLHSSIQEPGKVGGVAKPGDILSRTAFPLGRGGAPSMGRSSNQSSSSSAWEFSFSNPSLNLRDAVDPRAPADAAAGEENHHPGGSTVRHVVNPLLNSGTLRASPSSTRLPLPHNARPSENPFSWSVNSRSKIGMGDGLGTGRPSSSGLTFSSIQRALELANSQKLQ